MDKPDTQREDSSSCQECTQHRACQCNFSDNSPKGRKGQWETQDKQKG